MAEVVRTDIDNLNIKLTLTLTKEDYESKWKSELNKTRSKAQLKGFRKGKTPINFIKKMYGKAILADVVNQLVQDRIFDYLKNEDLKSLGQPIPSKDQPEMDFDVNNFQDFVFEFDLGLSPQFDLQGVGADDTYDVFKVEVSEEVLNKEIELAQRRGGERVTVEENIEERDNIKLEVKELDGDQLKEDGWASEFVVYYEDIANEDLKKEFLTKKTGDVVRLNVFTLEKDRDAEYVRKYFLNVTENDADVEIGEDFEATIAEVTRIKPAELNQEFFDKYFGPDKVKSAEEMKAFLKEDFQKFYERQTQAFFNRDVNDALLEKNELPLPDAFLKRWLMFADEKSSAEDIENGYDDFAKSLRWSLVRGELVKKFELDISDDELFEGLKNKVRGLFAQYGQGQVDEFIILNTANRLMENEEESNRVYRELMDEKIFNSIREIVNVDEKNISQEDFDEMVKAENEKLKAEQEAKQAAQAATENIENENSEEDEAVAENME